ncbi:hypothetical protein BC829DRAFT_394928 [Chytridium lagenaria]|nr:hypothetical protein BC829DRAFT_394928 [Chytridium lagenaria]
MSPSPVVAAAITGLTTLAGATASGLGVTMLLLPWFNVYGPDLKGYVLVRERSIFKECITTNLNLTNNIPISRNITYNCYPSGGTPCKDEVDLGRREACYNQTKTGYLSVATTVFTALALFIFLATLFLAISKHRKAATNKIYNLCSATGLSIAAVLSAVAGICAALARYFMGLTITFADNLTQGLGKERGIPIKPVDNQIATRTSVAAAFIAILAAMLMPWAFSEWNKYFAALDANRMEAKEEEGAVDTVEVEGAKKI